MEIPGGGGEKREPSGTENPGGWGLKWEKTLRGGGMDIFWSYTLNLSVSIYKFIHLDRERQTV